ncbi:MAG: hypothetical protein RBR40_02790 [Tenuifilaceae bacterium]|nr:hypothetical protein [Tenuifilaceae bacterium]
MLKNAKLVFLLVLLGLILLSTKLLSQITDESYEYEIDASPASITLSENELIQELKKTLQNDSTNTISWLMLGKLWENMMQYDSALYAYSSANRYDTTNAKCKQLQAGVYAKKGMITKSLEAYQAALVLDPTNATTRSQYALLLKRDRRFTEAYKQFNTLVQIDTANFYLWEQIGDCAIRIDSISIGHLAYLYSFELNPANMPVAVKLINGYIQSLVPPSLVMPFANKAYEQDTSYVPIIRSKGYLHFLDKDYKNSAIWLAKCYAKGDSSKFTLKHLGISSYQNGKFLMAHDLLDNFYKQDSTDNVANYFFAKAAMAIGQWKKAISLLDLTEELIKPDPEEVSMIYAARAEAYTKGGNHKLAIKNYEHAYTITPSNNDYLLKLGKSYYMAKNYKSSKEALESLIANLNERPKNEVSESQISTAEFYLRNINKELFFRE